MDKDVSIAAEIMESMHEAMQQLSKRFRSQNTDLPLKPCEISVLMCIWRHNKTSDSNVTPTHLAAFLGVTGPSITAILNTLEEKGFIERKLSKTDRRISEISFTEEGSKLISIISNEFYKSVIQLVDELGEQDSKEFLRLLNCSSAILAKANIKQKNINKYQLERKID
jgi:DNA-binding MarR family transcriptional regulator